MLARYAILVDETGDWKEALRAYKKALPFFPGGVMPIEIAFTPDNPQPQLLAAAAHLILGRVAEFHNDMPGRQKIDKVLDEYSIAVQLEPEWTLSNLYYGRRLALLGRDAEAKAAFNKALQLAQSPEERARLKDATRLH